MFKYQLFWMIIMIIPKQLIFEQMQITKYQLFWIIIILIPKQLLLKQTTNKCVTNSKLIFLMKIFFKNTWNHCMSFISIPNCYYKCTVQFGIKILCFVQRCSNDVIRFCLVSNSCFSLLKCDDKNFMINSLKSF